MPPTNEQIIAEAERRWLEEYKANGGKLSPNSSKEVHVINIMRENWTPPEPVDPDILAFREWVRSRDARPEIHRAAGSGEYDGGLLAEAFVAGARMAAERERERAEVLDWLADKTALELHWRADPEEDGTWCVHIAVGGVNDREWNLLATGETPLAALKSARTALAKYRGEA